MKKFKHLNAQLNDAKLKFSKIQHEKEQSKKIIETNSIQLSETESAIEELTTSKVSIRIFNKK